MNVGKGRRIGTIMRHTMHCRFMFGRGIPSFYTDERMINLPFPLKEMIKREIPPL